MEQFPKQKNQDQLQQQVAQAALFGGDKFASENMPDLLTMSEEELKSKYPDQYENYIAVLRAKKERLPATTRRFCIKITEGDKQYLSKAVESSFEPQIAQKAAELGVGPEQLESLPGTIREEFISGTPLLEISQDQCTPEFMERLGEETAQKIALLHKNNILINDQILTNDFGKSHFILDDSKEVRFIDFGAAIDMTDYPNISDEAVYSLMRTDPMAGFILHGITQEDLITEIAKYREGVLSHFPNKEDIIRQKDIQLLREGLSFLSTRLPNVQAFAKGVTKVLSQKD